MAERQKRSLVSLIVFPSMGCVFHIYQTQWLGRTAAPAEAWQQWPIEVQDAPKVLQLEEGEVRLHMSGDIARGAMVTASWASL